MYVYIGETHIDKKICICNYNIMYSCIYVQNSSMHAHTTPSKWFLSRKNQKYLFSTWMSKHYTDRFSRHIICMYIYKLTFIFILSFCEALYSAISLDTSVNILTNWVWTLLSWSHISVITSHRGANPLHKADSIVTENIALSEVCTSRLSMVSIQHCLCSNPTTFLCFTTKASMTREAQLRHVIKL